MKIGMKLFGIMIAIACSCAASTPIQAQEAKSDSASASSDDNARLVVNRAANLGILESISVFIDGVQLRIWGLIKITTRSYAPGSMCCR